jgi:hypothetical protein
MARSKARATAARAAPRARASRGSTAARAPPLASAAALVELRLKGPRIPHWLNDLGTRYGGIVRVHVCRATEERPRRLIRLLEVTAPADKLEAISAHLRERAGPGNVAETRLGPQRLIARLTTPLPAICQSVFDLGAICTSCPFLPDGGEEESDREWSLLVARAADATPVLRSLSGEGSPSRLIRLGKLRGPPDLTPRQELAIHLAARMGYFEMPRRADLKGVAAALGVSRPTAMEILRRAVAKLAERHGTAPSFVRAFRAEPSPG